MKRILAIALVMGITLAGTQAFAVIAGGKHDLRNSGASAFKGASDEVCRYCHVPHNAVENYPLWSRDLGGAVNTYNSVTIDMVRNATAQDVSAKCLTCHDGTSGAASGTTFANIALGAEVNTAANLGTDLVNTHPISITYSNVADPDFVAVPVAPIRLYGAAADQVECGSCHDPHGPVGMTYFLRMSNAGSALCLACHVK